MTAPIDLLGTPPAGMRGGLHAHAPTKAWDPRGRATRRLSGNEAFSSDLVHKNRGAMARTR